MSGAVHIGDVDYRYGRDFALRGVSADIPVGVTALLGPNGAGKSTLLGLLSTALKLQRGNIVLDGLDSVRNAEKYRKSVGFLPQRFDAPNHLTISEFLTLSAWWRKVPGSQRKSAVEQALRMTSLQDRAGSKIGHLSGGMLRRLGIAQAVVNSPTMLLLDEPTVGLDPRQRGELREVITDIGKTRTVLVSTHLTEDVVAVAEQVAMLDRGELIHHGRLEDLVGESPSAPELDRTYAAMLGREETA